jgi:hypothetical protein
MSIIKPHSKDSDCNVGADGCCTECGVSHTDACPRCGGRGFHVDDPNGPPCFLQSLPANTTPDEHLAMLRKHARAVYEDVASADPSSMAELFMQLDEYLTKNVGQMAHLPEDWKP